MSRVLFLSLLLSATVLAGNPGIDPTQPPRELQPSAATSSDSPLLLQAVVRGAQGSRAIIAGHSLRVGEHYADARVLAIYAQSVLIERQGQQQLLRLAEPVMQPSR